MPNDGSSKFKPKLSPKTWLGQGDTPPSTAHRAENPRSVSAVHNVRDERRYKSEYEQQDFGWDAAEWRKSPSVPPNLSVEGVAFLEELVECRPQRSSLGI
jgi:hypothetical protein